MPVITAAAMAAALPGAPPTVTEVEDGEIYDRSRWQLESPSAAAKASGSAVPKKVISPTAGYAGGSGRVQARAMKPKVVVAPGDTRCASGMG